MGGVVLCLGRAAWSFGGVVFLTPPSFFYTSLLPPAATDRTLAWLVATERCVCVAYDCLAVASAAACVMGLARRFSIRRVVVSVAIGVVVATLADVGVRMSMHFFGWPSQHADVPVANWEEVKVDVPDGWIDMHVVPSLLIDRAVCTWAPGLRMTSDAMPKSASPPAWLHDFARPYRSRTVFSLAYVYTFGWPLRSSVSEQTLTPSVWNPKDVVKWYRGDMWFQSTDAGDDTFHRIRVLPALFNVGCFTVAAWVVLAGLAAAARARRCSRGGCAVCGYAIGKLAVCPECGTAGRATTAGSTVARRVAPPDHVAIMQSIAQFLVAWHMHVRC